MKGERFALLVRVAGISIIGGLLVDIITLIWSHHLAFLFFMIFGGIFIIGGILLFLYVVISRSEIANNVPESNA